VAALASTVEPAAAIATPPATAPAPVSIVRRVTLRASPASMRPPIFGGASRRDIPEATVLRGPCRVQGRGGHRVGSVSVTRLATCPRTAPKYKPEVEIVSGTAARRHKVTTVAAIHVRPDQRRRRRGMVEPL
jgi:hypothetical protein